MPALLEQRGIVRAPRPITLSAPKLRPSATRASVQTANGRLFFGTSFEPEVDKGAAERFPLYDGLASYFEGRGLETFLPHRDIPEDISPRETHNNIRRNITGSNYMVVDLTVPSHAVGGMIQLGWNAALPMVGFYKRGTRVEPAVLGRFTYGKLIEIPDEDDTLRMLATAVLGSYDP